MSPHLFLQAAFIVILTITFVCRIEAHPQCLDFRAPFRPAQMLTLCPEYSGVGCCGVPADNVLKEEYEYIRSRVTSSDWEQCQKFIRVALCQRCSPYAAHIYDAEENGQPRFFPGLCRNYCEEFFDKCRQIVWFLDPKLAAVTLLGSKKRFCDKVAITDKDYCFPDVLVNFSPLKNYTSNVQSSSGCLCLEKVKDGLANPLYARPAYDGSGRVFVAEQVGRVHIYDAVNNQWKGIFLDFTRKAYVTAFPGDERGLLGMAFHPQFSTNRRFFVFYSTVMRAGDALPPEFSGLLVRTKVVVSEMKVKESKPDEADPSSEKTILQLPQPYANHNGGEMFFGPDGYLYTFHGDGGSAGDPLKAGQDRSLLYGKVLRLDVDSDPSQPYTIPPDNPFVGEAGVRPEIFAYGVRNIWRCGIDRGANMTGPSKGILCGDVGQGKYEEIDLLKKGANYGWNAREGFECFKRDLCGNIGPEELPITAYDHSVGKSVCGGVFYRGCQNPALEGQYIYGDYATRRLFSLTESGGVWTNKDVDLCGKDLCQGDLLNDVQGKIMSFGEDEQGEIYVLTSPRAASRLKNGHMLKFVDPRTRNDPNACAQKSDVRRRTPLPRRRSLVETAHTIGHRKRTKSTKTGRKKKTKRLPSISISVTVSGRRRQDKIRRKQRWRTRRLRRLCRRPRNKHNALCQALASETRRNINERKRHKKGKKRPKHRRQKRRVYV